MSRPPGGYFTKAVREFFDNMKTVPTTDPRFKSALEYARRSYDSFGNPEDSELLDEPSKKRFIREGAGRKAQDPDF